MATNADHYRSYNTGVVEMYRGYIEEAREAAELTNKSIAERRSELQKIIRDIDSDIMSAQRALETGQTTHFKAHLDQKNRRNAARSRALRGRTKASSELEKIRVKAREKMARAVDEAAALANANPEVVWDQNAAFTTATQTPSIAAFLGQIGLEPGGGGVISDDVKDAVTLGFNEGYNIGLRAYNMEPDPDEVVEAVRQITGVGEVTPQDLDDVKSAAGNRVVSSATQRSSTGGMTDADVDAALEESGLAGSIRQRQADIERMQAQRQATMAEAARLPGEMGEEEILQQAAGRMGQIGRYAGQPRNFIAVQRQLNDARRRLAEQQAKIAENETQRAAIESMSPSQRILLQASLDGLDMRQRHPRGIPPELTREALDFSTQIRNAMRNDPKIRGNDKAIVELAINLAQQNNPDGSVEEIRAMRDLILQGVAFEQTKRDDVAAHLPKQMAEAERLRQERADNFEFGPIDLSEIEEEETVDDPLTPRARDKELYASLSPEARALVRETFDQDYKDKSERAQKTREALLRIALEESALSGIQFQPIDLSEIEQPITIDDFQFPSQAEAIEEVASPMPYRKPSPGLAALPLDPELEEQLLMQRAQ